VTSTERTHIVSVIVIEFITLDGIVSDPDGSGDTPTGGWAFQHGPETVAGGPPSYLECLSAEQAGAAVLSRYGRATR
jgi:hypothetical protein